MGRGLAAGEPLSEESREFFDCEAGLLDDGAAFEVAAVEGDGDYRAACGASSSSDVNRDCGEARSRRVEGRAQRRPVCTMAAGCSRRGEFNRNAARDRRGVLVRDVLAELLQRFEVAEDRLGRHRSGLGESVRLGDAAGQRRHRHHVTAFSGRLENRRVREPSGAD